MKNKPHVAALIGFLLQTEGTINWNVKKDMWKKIGDNPFVNIFQIGGQEYLERLTATSADEGLLDTLAEDIGLPKNFNRICDALVEIEEEGSLQLDLTDGETGIHVNLESKSGINILIKSAIRILGSLEKADEF